jgi:Protein of unknown function (DUF499)
LRGFDIPPSLQGKGVKIAVTQHLPRNSQYSYSNKGYMLTATCLRCQNRNNLHVKTKNPMSSAYQIKPWTQVVTPHADILSGNLDNATYAASLGAVIRQDSQCPVVYRNAPDFFAATYLTTGLRKLLEDVLKGLQGDAGNRVLQLRTPFGRQVLTFIQKLTEVVRESPKTVLVYSLQASVGESFGNEGLLSPLNKLVSRIDAKKEPVSGDEVMRVVQRRLFSNIGDTTIIQEIAKQQAEIFRKFRESYAETSREKQEIQQQADLLAERILSSYPFHPDLIDLMYYRWVAFPAINGLAVLCNFWLR